MAAQAPRGCCPGRAAARRTRDTPQNSGRHRLVAGNSVGMLALAGLRESGAPHRLLGISADKPSKEALHRRPIGETQAKARSVARLCRSFCENGGLASADRGEHAARQRPYRSPPAAVLVQKAPKTALGRAAAPTQVHGAQLRRRMRRRKGGGDVREPESESESAPFPLTSRFPFRMMRGMEDRRQAWEPHRQGAR